MLRLSLLGALGVIAVTSGSLRAQEIVEIDTETGRTIIDDEWRSMYFGLTAVDWDRGLLYVDDREEPEGIMVFSLQSGEHVRTISTPRGDGPREFPRNRRGIAIGPDGRIYISGFVRVLEYDASGEYQSTWQPVRPPSREVCDFGGAPAVATQGGVLRRGPYEESGYEEQEFGNVETRSEHIRAATTQEGVRIGVSLMSDTHIVCSDTAAYVVTARDEGPATVDVYRLDGSMDALEITTDGATSRTCTIQATGQPCPHWSRQAHVSLDNYGNLVLLGTDGRTHGAIVNPETGCHALIRADGNRRFIPIAVHADSALVLYSKVSEATDNRGRAVQALDPNSASKLAVHPIRRYSGEPCQGVLPDVPAAR